MTLRPSPPTFPRSLRWLLRRSFLLFAVLCGCSAIFDLEAVDAELVDVRADLMQLWQLPPNFMPFISANYNALFNSEDQSPSRTIRTSEPTAGLAPYVRGLDGELYFPARDFSHSPSAVRVYRVPSGEPSDEFFISGNALLPLILDKPPLIMSLEPPTPPRAAGRVVLYRLGATPLQETIPATHSWVQGTGGSKAVMSSDPDAKPRFVQVIRHRPPDQLLRTQHALPSNLELMPKQLRDPIRYDPTSDALFYVTEDGHLWGLPIATDTPVDLGVRSRLVTLPDLIVLLNAERRLSVYSWSLRQAFDLPLTLPLPAASWRVEASRPWLVLCMARGVFTIDLGRLPDSPTVQQLDDRSCSRIQQLTTERVNYLLGPAELGEFFAGDPESDRSVRQFSAPLDGSQPTEEVFSTGPLTSQPLTLARCSNGLRAYNMNRQGTSDVTRQDAWINGWRFSEDAGEVRFSRDCQRVRWIEHPQVGGIGELFSAEIGSGPRLRLARNVREFYELGDGRVLTLANRHGLANEARLILLDEAERRGYWLLDQTETIFAVRHIAPALELLVQTRYRLSSSSALNLRYARLPIPPRPSSARATN